MAARGWLRYPNGHHAVKWDCEVPLRKPDDRTPPLHDCWHRVYSTGSRVLLVCMLGLTLAMPWTEYFWHFDQFLHGGQDFELGLIAVLAVLCLLLVLCRPGRARPELLQMLRRWLTLLPGYRAAQAPGAHAGLTAILHALPLPGGTPGRGILPLRV